MNEETLNEHRKFRNGLIIFTILMITVGAFLPEGTILGFGIVIGILAILNIFTYRDNKRKYDEGSL